MEYFGRNQNILPNQAKDLYYKLFRSLEEAARQLKLTLSDKQENLIDALEKIFSFGELHQKLSAKQRPFSRQWTIQRKKTPQFS